MKVGIIGLGRMGAGIAARLAHAGIDVVGYDISVQMRERSWEFKLAIAPTVQELMQHVHVLWIFVPAGDAVDDVLNEIVLYAQPGSIIIDGGNSKFTDSQRRAHALEKKGIFFLDCGTSGGIHGAEHGFSLMIGGNKKAFDTVEHLFAVVAAPHGYGYMGPSGTGHYVKMVHNGIEYALMQAYGEGLQLLKEGSFKDVPLDLAHIARVWNHGAVIRSWLLELTQEILEKDQDLKSISGAIQESGTGQWTVQEAEQRNVPVPTIDVALNMRAWSRESGGNYATKIVALLRKGFGGHSVKKIE